MFLILSVKIGKFSLKSLLSKSLQSAESVERKCVAMLCVNQREKLNGALT